QAAPGGGAPSSGTPGDASEAPYEGGGTHTPGNMQASGQPGAGGSNQGGGYGSGTGDGASDNGAGRTPSNAVQYTPAPITGDLRAGAPNIAALPGLPNQAAPSAPAANYAPSAASDGGEQAITQERVPIVYRQWVKRYFDS
ncbi:MAG TPA: hypothetical protein VFK80_02520, partial [Limnochordia bacterium]|nr:hypothetical protein [Limnochordia bacterium]